MVMSETEQAQSSGLAMSAMMAVLKMFYDRQSTYVSVLIALQQVYGGVIIGPPYLRMPRSLGINSRRLSRVIIFLPG